LILLRNIFLWLLSQIEVEKIRPASRNAYLKIADCHVTKVGSAEDVQRCSSKYTRPLEHASKIVQAGIQNFQSGFENCTRDCFTQQTLGYSEEKRNNQDEMLKVLGKCHTSCGDKYLAQINATRDAINEGLKQALN
jgi:hypothetical protein